MINQLKLARHRLTLDARRSRIKKLGALDDGLYCGEVSGVADNGIHLAFIIREGQIQLSDLQSKKSKFNFVYDLSSGSYQGVGTVNHYRDCERFVAYVLIMLSMMGE